MYALQGPCRPRADLEPPDGLGLGLALGLGLGLGSGRSGPTCKVDIGHTDTAFCADLHTRGARKDTAAAAVD